MRAGLAAACVGCLVAVTIAGETGAAEPPGRTYRHVLEIDGYTGLERMVAPKPSHAGELSAHNGGMSVALGATYRTRYFLSPFIDVGYYPLYSSESNVDLGNAGGRAHAVSSVFAWGVVAGPAFDFWRLRARAGIGADDVIVHASVLGQTARAAELDLGYAFSLGGFLLIRDRFRIGIEGRLVMIVDASMTALSIGTTIGWDPVRF